MYSHTVRIQATNYSLIYPCTAYLFLEQTFLDHQDVLIIFQDLSSYIHSHPVFSETTDFVFESVNSTYQIIKKELEWLDTQAHCHAIHGHLLALETEEEFSSISAYIPDDDHHFGLNDLKEERKYVWEHSGQELGTYQPWARWEPSNVWYEDCGTLTPRGWHDGKCIPHFSFHFICEFAKE